MKTVSEITRDLEIDRNKRPNQPIYKIQSGEFKKQELSADIQRVIDIFSVRRPKVNFRQSEEVQTRIVEYFTACANAGVYPSVQGLAVQGFGVSRQALNQWRNKHQDLDSTKLIEMACDLIADILTNQSLHNNANPVQALFQLKNNHAFTDRVEVAPVYSDRVDEISVEEIEKRYLLPEGD